MNINIKYAMKIASLQI